MQSGKIKRPIVINALSTSQDAFGQPVQTWTQLLQTWAEINAISSKEVYALSAGFDSQVTHSVVIRFRVAVVITAGMQVVYRNRVFLIQAVTDPTEERRELHLLCLEQTK